MSANIFDFKNTLNNYEMFQNWLEQNDLISFRKQCPQCHGEMRLVKGKLLWICSLKTAHDGKKLVAERACIKAPSLTELREAAKKRAHLDEKQGEPIPVPGGGHC